MPRQTTADTGYEYKVVKVPRTRPKAHEREINKRARDGWEMVTPFSWATSTITFRRAKASR